LGIVVPALDLLTQLLLVVLGLVLVFSPHALAHGTSLGSNPSWHDLAFALSPFPGPKTELGTKWVNAPLLGVADRIDHKHPWDLGGVLRFYVGITGALILLAAVTTSVSGFSRLAYSLGEH